MVSVYSWSAETFRENQWRNGEFDRGGRSFGQSFRNSVCAFRSRSCPGLTTKRRRLVAVTNEPKLTMEEIRAAIKAKGLSNLYVPREIKCVREIPKLGTGKINHRELQKLVEGQ